MLSSVLSDQELVKNYLNGDNSSFEILLTRHKSRIFAFIMSKVKNRDLSEDIFQDTFIKVIKTLKKGRYSEEGKFLPWVMRIAHNLVIDHFRKNKRMPKFEGSDDFNIFSVIYFRCIGCFCIFSFNFGCRDNNRIHKIPCN